MKVRAIVNDTLFGDFFKDEVYKVIGTFYDEDDGNWEGYTIDANGEEVFIGFDECVVVTEED